MTWNKIILNTFLAITAISFFAACTRKEDSLPNLAGIDNTAKFSVKNYNENGLDGTSAFAASTYQFGISEIFQITKSGAIIEGKWKIENGSIIIKDITTAPFTKLNNTWVISENNAFNIVAAAQNGSSTSNISFAKIP